MKQFLLGLLAFGMVVSTQAMMQESDLDRPLLDATEMQDVLLEDDIQALPVTPVHAPGSMSADISPVAAQADTAEAAPMVVVEPDIHALLNDPSLDRIFAKTPALKTILELQTKKIEMTEQKLQQILDIVEQLRQADHENSLPKKQRILASALELGLLTPAMMVYTYFLDKPGYNTAQIVQHYTAQSWLRNLSDVNPLGKLIIALIGVGVAQGIDYHVAIPYLGNAIGVAPLTIFIALGLILHEAGKSNHIKKTTETICHAAGRFGNWIKSFRKSPATSS